MKFISKLLHLHILFLLIQRQPRSQTHVNIPVTYLYFVPINKNPVPQLVKKCKWIYIIWKGIGGINEFDITCIFYIQRRSSSVPSKAVALSLPTWRIWRDTCEFILGKGRTVVNTVTKPSVGWTSSAYMSGATRGKNHLNVTSVSKKKLIQRWFQKLFWSWTQKLPITHLKKTRKGDKIKVIFLISGM